MSASLRRRARTGMLAGLIGLGACLHVAASAGDCGPYRVGVGEYPRLYERQHTATSGVDPGAAYQGMSKDFYDLLAERSGCSFNIEVESQPRLWRRLRDGSLDVTAWVIPTPERKPIVVVIPLLSLHLMAITWSNQQVRSQAEFLEHSALRAVAVRDSAYGPAYDALFQTLHDTGRLSEVADVDSAVKVFAARRVDLLIGYPWALTDLIVQNSGATRDELRVSDWHPDAPDVVSGLALSRRTVSDENQRRLLEALKQMQRDGSLGRIVDKYLPASSVKLVPNFVPQ